MPNFTFDEKEHVYTLDGKPLQGVTTILRVISKPALIQWSANCAVDFIETAVKSGLELTDQIYKDARLAHRKKKEKAGEEGTDAHSLIELMIKNAIEKNGGYILETETGINTILDSFVKWANENKVKFLASELRLYSREHWYAGTADMVCEIGGKLYVGDVKTGSAIYPEYFIQTSAYAHALVEMGLYEQFGGVVIVNARKDGSIEIKGNYALEGNFECFKACLVLHRHLQAINPK